MTRLSISAMICLVALSLNTGCDAMLDAALSKSEAMAEKEIAKENDRFVDAALKGGTEDGKIAVATSEFFANTQKYTLWSGNASDFKSLADKCIAAGATAAYALPSKEDGLCDSFAFALPADKSARTKVFDTYNQFWKEMIKVPAVGANATEDDQEAADVAQEELDMYLAKDVGQKYIFFAHDD